MKYLNEYNKHQDEELYGYDYIEIKHIKEIVDNSIKIFKSKLNVFRDITVKLAESIPTYHNALAFYSHGSAVSNDLHPFIVLNYEELKKISDEELKFAVETTIFHELGHAMVDLDNAFLFKKDTNIFHFDDEEDFVEEFAFNLSTFNKVDPIFKELETYCQKIMKGHSYEIFKGYE